MKADAFSRVDLCAAIAAFFLLAIVVLPALAQPFGRSQRLHCLNNLRQIGQAFQVWGSDHGDEFPFYLPSSQGGTMGTPEASKAYYQLAVLSNYLSSPRVLACPSDPAVLADNFGAAPGGLLSAGYQDHAVSYFVSHGRVATGPEVLSGDRNIAVPVQTMACPFFVTTRGMPARMLSWREDVHGRAGNVLMTSGDVLETGTASLPAEAGVTQPTLPSHFVIPR